MTPSKSLYALLALAAVGATAACTEQTKNTYDKQAELASADTFKKSKVLFVFTNNSHGYNLSEASQPWVAFSQAGYEVDFASPIGGQPPVDSFYLADEADKSFWKNEDVQKKIKNTKLPKTIKQGDYKAVYFVGGHGAMWDFPDNADIAKIITDIYEQSGGIVGGVCHGPAAFVNIKLLSGDYLVKDKSVAAFTNAEEAAKNMTKTVPFLLQSKLTDAGAKFVTKPNNDYNVQVSDRLVTGQNKASAKGVADEMIKLLNAQATR